MTPLRPWLVAGRPAEALLPPLAVAVGSSYAQFDNQPGPGIPAHFLVTAAAFAAGFGIHLIEFGWDGLGEPPDGDESNAPAEPALGAQEAFAGGAAALLLAGLLGAALVPFSGSAALGYGLLAVALGVLRRAPLVGLDALGWGLGELGTFLALGPLAVVAGFASQARSGSSGAFLAGIPVGLIAVAASFVRHFTHRQADDRLSRSTPVASLGEDQARLLLAALPVIAGLGVIVAARVWEYGPWSIAAAAPLAVAGLTVWRLPSPATPAAYERWGRVALVCAAAALVAIAISLRVASPV